MKDKICRICWNTNGWRRPSGDAVKLESAGSFVHENGFGHEEWLFNYEWVIDGYMYGFLQPIGKFLKKYAGDSCNVLLYTFPPNSPPLLVGVIDNVEVLTGSQITAATQRFIEEGWLDQMKIDLAEVNGNVNRLGYPTEEYIVNIRFLRDNVAAFDPMPAVSNFEAFSSFNRYHPYNWDGKYSDLISPVVKEDDPVVPETLSDPRRSEEERIRAAQEGTSYDPQHVRLQNRLYAFLCERYGIEHVYYEKKFVDLSLVVEDRTIFYEIKLEKTVKRCIRLAVGQLLEYAHYPNVVLAQELVVVGDALPESEDKEYLELIRRRYGIPIRYATFDWESKALVDLI